MEQDIHIPRQLRIALADCDYVIPSRGWTVVMRIVQGIAIVVLDNEVYRDSIPIVDSVLVDVDSTLATSKIGCGVWGRGLGG